MGLNELCDIIDVKSQFVVANDHEAGGLREDEDHTLRFFNLHLTCHKRYPTKSMVVDQTYGDNVSLESRQASVFELRYGRYPSLTCASNIALLAVK